MRSLKVSVHHHLTIDEAITRIKKIFTNLRHEQKDKISNIHEDWKDGTGIVHFSAQGFDLSAIVTVHRSNIDIDANVPFAVYLSRVRLKK